MVFSEREKLKSLFAFYSIKKIYTRPLTSEEHTRLLREKWWTHTRRSQESYIPQNRRLRL